MTRTTRFWLILSGVLALSPLPVLAQGRGHGGGEKEKDRDRVERHDRDHDRDADRDRDRDRDNDRDDHHGTIFSRDSHGPANRPPGWDHGRKKGWGDCDEPPGLAKKDGCHSEAVVHHRHHSSRTTQATVSATARASGSVKTTRPTSHAPTPKTPLGKQISPEKR
jgi:hypothetical protein